MQAQPENDIWLPHIETGLCNGCAECIVRCPTGALGSAAGKAALVRPELCSYCAACEAICDTNAIELPYLICKPHDEGDKRP